MYNLFVWKREKGKGPARGGRKVEKGSRVMSLLVGVFILFGFVSGAQASTDVALLDEVTFSSETFFVGETVRVYASLRNVGDTDITGDVYFFIGSQQIGGSHEISMPKNGQKEEVFTDVVVPEGEFNIRIVISGIVPPETNTTNNELLSGLIVSVPDADGDRIADASDNCLSTKNEDQRDLDQDGEGNVCDDDIDGDGLSNTIEQANGTDPLNTDTDGDGASDKTDPTPLGEPLVVPKVETPVQKTEPTVTVTTETNSTSETSVTTDTSSDTSVSMPEDTNAPTSSETSASPTLFETSGKALSAPEASLNALFTFEETRWATYRFRIVAPVRDEGYRYEWGFGDGTTSNRKEVTHYYGRTGTFAVTLRMTDPEGQVSEDRVDVQIAFFDFQNRSVRMLIIFLVMILLIGVSAFFRLGSERREEDDTLEKPTQKSKPKKPVKSKKHDS